MNDAVILLHGGEVARRNQLSQQVRERLAGLRVRTSSRAAEAAKALADPASRAVVLVDAPADADAVRAAAASRGLGARVYELQPRDGAEQLVGLLRAAMIAPDASDRS